MPSSSHRSCPRLVDVFTTCSYVKDFYLEHVSKCSRVYQNVLKCSYSMGVPASWSSTVILDCFDNVSGCRRCYSCAYHTHSHKDNRTDTLDRHTLAIALAIVVRLRVVTGSPILLSAHIAVLCPDRNPKIVSSFKLDIRKGVPIGFPPHALQAIPLHGNPGRKAPRSAREQRSRYVADVTRTIAAGKKQVPGVCKNNLPVPVNYILRR